jgi:acyl-CoA synthetase (NDP forming)
MAPSRSNHCANAWFTGAGFRFNFRRPSAKSFGVNSLSIEAIIRRALAESRSELSEFESKKILEAAGISTTMPAIAIDPDSAVALAAEFGSPVVLKVASPDVTHKSDVGGVALNLASDQAVRGAFEEIKANLARRMPQARFDGVTVQKMVVGGTELIAGIIRDPNFGPMVMVGFGGIFAEILKDTVFRLAPFDVPEAIGMIGELKGAALLKGSRGQPPAALDTLAELLATLSQLAAEQSAIAEMDLNPVSVSATGVCALDARAMLRFADADPKPTGTDRKARLENLGRAFNAKAVAVIGDKRAGGYMWLRAHAHYTGGKLYSVQIDPNEIPAIEAMGVPNYKSLAEIPEPIDYAITAVPRQVAPRILKDCIANNVRGVTFFTSGFSETGEELGIKLEAEMKSLIAESDIALVGPNCMGLYNPAIGICNFPGEKTGEAGDVCFISQSGTHTINFAMQAAVRGIRINKAASIGNAIALDAADYIDLMAADPATRVIGMYIEGASRGRAFFESLRRAAARLPVVVWKGGVTEAGARATFSHTASLATGEAVWSTVMSQSGAVAVPNADAMLDAVELFARGRNVTGRRIGLVAMTGGQSVVITDAFSKAGLEIPALSEASYQELKSFFNIIGGSYRNPLDAGGTIATAPDQGNLDRILDILDRDLSIDSIALEVGTGLRAARWATHEEEIARLLDKLSTFAGRSNKPFVVILHPAHVEAVVARAKELARARGLVVFDSFDRAAAAMKVCADYWINRLR